MKPPTSCSAEGCEKPAHARGLCKAVHYTRWCRDKKNAGQKQSYKLTHEENFLRFPLMKEGDCLVWTRARDENGYGRVGGYKQGTAFAHRVALSIHLGRPVSESVLHDCDNPPCCNPKHLYEGTQQQNVEDARVRDRVKHGEEHWNRKIDASDVRDIRMRYERREATQRQMALEYGVHVNTIYDVVHRKTWVRA